MVYIVWALNLIIFLTFYTVYDALNLVIKDKKKIENKMKILRFSDFILINNKNWLDNKLRKIEINRYIELQS